MDQSAQLTSWPAPAKINLALHVTGQRADGYHLLESLVVFTRFGDRLSVEPAEADEFVVSGPFAAQVPTDDGNLVIAARDRLREFLQRHDAVEDTFLPYSNRPSPPSGLPAISPSRGEIGGCDVDPRSAPSEIGETEVASRISSLEGEMAGRPEGGVGRDVPVTALRQAAGVSPVLLRLEKNLPVASGIGGGSSDAAAALRALAGLWAPDLSKKILHEIALTLGADVPMCLEARPLIARGVGEALSPVGGFPALGLVLVNPGVPVSTAEVFSALASRDKPPLPPLPRHLDFHSIRNWLGTTRNDLETPARTIEPSIGAALAALDEAGSGFSRMSGSGATCFGLFETGNVAKRAAASIRARHPGWFVAATRSIASEAEE